MNQPLYRAKGRHALFTLAPVIVLAGLTGCAHSPLSSQWPVPPAALEVAFNPLDPNIPANARMSAVDAALSKLVVAAGEEARHASERDWGSGDVVTVGGLMAVLGGMAEKIGLVNTGAAIGLVGGSGRARYQYPIQRQAYRRAETSLACVQTQVRLLNDDNRVLVLSAGTADEKTGASKAPMLAIEAVNRVRRQLMGDLDAVGGNPLSRQDIDSLVQKQQAADAPTPPITAAEAASAVNDAMAAGALRSSSIQSLARADKTRNSSGAPSDTPQLSAWLNAAPYAGEIGTPALPTVRDSKQAEWLVTEARNIAKTYPAELAKCGL